MGITRAELVQLKSKVKAEMLRRDGLGPSSGKRWSPSKAFGPLSAYGSASYDFTHTPTKDDRIYAEYGEKTIDLLLKIAPKSGLQATSSNNPIPSAFNGGLITYADKLASEAFTGETSATISARKSAGENASALKVETSSCNAACSGLCVGSCIGMCNGCLGACSATCGTGCNSGLRVEASGCIGTCSGTCSTTCAKACKTCVGCTNSCGTGCAGSTMAANAGCTGACSGTCSTTCAKACTTCTACTASCGSGCAGGLRA